MCMISGERIFFKTFYFRERLRAWRGGVKEREKERMSSGLPAEHGTQSTEPDPRTLRS